MHATLATERGIFVEKSIVKNGRTQKNCAQQGMPDESIVLYIIFVLFFLQYYLLYFMAFLFCLRLPIARMVSNSNIDIYNSFVFSQKLQDYRFLGFYVHGITKIDHYMVCQNKLGF